MKNRSPGGNRIESAFGKRVFSGEWSSQFLARAGSRWKSTSRGVIWVMAGAAVGRSACMSLV